MSRSTIETCRGSGNLHIPRHRLDQPASALGPHGSRVDRDEADPALAVLSSQGDRQVLTGRIGCPRADLPIRGFHAVVADQVHDPAATLQNGNSAVRITPPPPASPVSRDFRYNFAKTPAVGALLALGMLSPRSEFLRLLAYCAENLRASSAIFPFSGETSRRLGSITLRGRGSSRQASVGAPTRDGGGPA